MNMKLLIVAGFLTSAVCMVPAVAQDSSAVQRDTSNPAKAANPQMSRLAARLAGDWDTVETMERSSFFPQGGSRTGRVHATLASGGYALLYEVHSNGTAGQLDGFHAIWWDPKAKLYRFFSCFNDPGEPCVDRGTAHWQGESLVNDYSVEVDGKPIPGRDTFTFTPTTHTLVAEMQSGNNRKLMKLITTRATRH